MGSSLVPSSRLIRRVLPESLGSTKLGCGLGLCLRCSHSRTYHVAVVLQSFVSHSLSCRSLVGGPIAGAILTHQHGSFDGLIIFAGVTMMIGGSVIALVKLQLNRNLLAKV
jgi:hypothetical protein